MRYIFLFIRYIRQSAKKDGKNRKRDYIFLFKHCIIVRDRKYTQFM